jgi:hypothetical protein
VGAGRAVGAIGDGRADGATVADGIETAAVGADDTVGSDGSVDGATVVNASAAEDVPGLTTIGVASSLAGTAHPVVTAISRIARSWRTCLLIDGVHPIKRYILILHNWLVSGWS